MANKTKQSHKRNAIDLRTKRSGSRVIEFFGPISTLILFLKLRRLIVSLE